MADRAGSVVMRRVWPRLNAVLGVGLVVAGCLLQPEGLWRFVTRDGRIDDSLTYWVIALMAAAHR